MKLSILIPSYNMSKKIDACLDSIYSLTASEDNYEIIVFDSSNDDSMSVLKNWALKHKNLKVIHSDNQTRCGTARNIAYQQSAGQYIFCMDIDDYLVKDSLQKILDGLSGLDMYYVPYVSLRDNQVLKLNPKTAGLMALSPVGVWCKIYKREKYIPFPDYMPEDVCLHYLVIDRCSTFGYFDFPFYVYDNTPLNVGAISRTFDYLFSSEHNLVTLAEDNVLIKNNLRDEYLYGVLRNFADMYLIRNKLLNPDVRACFINRFRNTYRNIMSGIYIH